MQRAIAPLPSARPGASEDRIEPAMALDTGSHRLIDRAGLTKIGNEIGGRLDSSGENRRSTLAREIGSRSRDSRGSGDQQYHQYFTRTHFFDFMESYPASRMQFTM